MKKPVTVIIVGAGGRGFAYANLARKAPKLCKIVGVAEPRDFHREKMVAEHGIAPETLAEWESKGVADWLEGFHDTEASVRRTVDAIVDHPLVPKDVVVRGFIIDSVTGALTEVR